MREELGQTISRYLRRAGEWVDADVLVEDRFLQQLRALAQVIAALRSPAARDRQHHVLYPPQREIGTRLVKQLQKLAKALANWRERVIVSAEDYATARRVALDCVPGGRCAVIAAPLAADGLAYDEGGRPSREPVHGGGKRDTARPLDAQVAAPGRRRRLFVVGDG